MKNFLKALILSIFIATCLSVVAFADEATVPETYEESDLSYTVYTETQLVEVFNGIYGNTLENKTIIFGCDITSKTDLILTNECDITIDLNGKTYTNTLKSGGKTGDFDFQNENAIIRIKNGTIKSSFCVFIFRTKGQVYGENLDIISQEECFYQYNGHSGVVNLKNCNIDVIGSYSSVSLGGDCREVGNGTLYQIDGGSFDGLNIYCPAVGSYVKNCRVYSRGLNIDAWHSHGTDNTDVTVKFENVTVDEGLTVKLNDTRVDPVFYDSTFSVVDLTGSSQLLVAYTSASCSAPATKTTYAGADTGTLDEQYSLDNPALPHSAPYTDCTIDIFCEMCNAVVVYEALYESHDVKAESISYESFASHGIKNIGCKNCPYKSTEKASAIFTALGYSYRSDGTGINGGFSINDVALNEYESVTGDKIYFGLLLINPEFATADTFLVNGELMVKENAVQTKINSSEYSGFGYTITGLNENTELDLIICAYAYSDVNELEFIQKQYTDTEKSACVETFEKADGKLYSVSATSVMSADANYIVPSKKDE